MVGKSASSPRRALTAVIETLHESAGSTRATSKEASLRLCRERDLRDEILSYLSILGSFEFKETGSVNESMLDTRTLDRELTDLAFSEVETSNGCVSSQG